MPPITYYKAGRILLPDFEYLTNGYVAVEDGRIRAVESGIVPHGDVVDLGQDATILPGWMDLHVHLVWDGSLDPRAKNEKEPPALTALRAWRHAYETLRSGVTTVRDTGGPFGVPQALSRAQQMGIVAAPRIVAAGQAIMMTGGHGWYFGREADGVDGVRHAVRKAIKEGAQVIKVMATGGVYTEGERPHQSQLTLEEIRVAVEEAHKRGLRVAAHAEGLDGIRNAVLAGVDTVEHGCFLDEDTAALMAQRGTYLVPTVSTFTVMARAGYESGLAAFVVEKSREVADATRHAVAVAKRAGVRIAAGTDAGGPAHPHSPLALELELLTECGLTPAEAIRAATRTAAEALALEGVTGALEEGAFADMVAVRGDVLQDIRAVRSVVAVVQGGVRYV
jgi:imidazolonepropionase-like amidohydrolase